jgi:hypothetical protein
MSYCLSSDAMKQIILISLTILASSAFSQNYSFAKDFVKGAVYLKDSSRKAGQVKWIPQQNQKLKFRETENGETTSYSPEDIAGFSADTFKFISLYKFDACAENYALLGKTSNIKHTFAEVLDTGKFNIYFVLITAYDPLSGALQTYSNFLFQNGHDANSKLIPFPHAIRMKDKKYENAKENLYLLFKDYPEIVEKLKANKKQDDFSEIVNMVKAANRQ